MKVKFPQWQMPSLQGAFACAGWLFFAIITFSTVLSWSHILIAQDPTTMIPQATNFNQAHPDLELYYQTRKAAEIRQQQTLMNPVLQTQTTSPSLSNSIPPTQQVKVMQGTEIVSAFADLGGTLGALGFASWLCVYLLKLHEQERQAMREAFTSERTRVTAEREKERLEFTEERKLHLSKDSDNDAAMRQSLEASQKQLIEIVHSNQQQVNDLKEIMQTHSQDLKGIMLELKMSIATGFEQVHNRWDGTERRMGNEKSSSSTSRSRAKSS